jgi:hypothetical protein
VDNILSQSNREVTANRSWCGVLRIRGSHETSHDLPRVLGTLHDQHQRGTLRDEFHEFVVVGLALVLDVVALGRWLVNSSQFGRDDTQLLVFETPDDFTDEAARDTVGLHYEERSIHDEAI